MLLAGDSATYGDSAIDTCIGAQSTTGVTGFTKLGNCVTSAAAAVSTSVNSESGNGDDVVDVRGVMTGKGVGELR